MRSGHLYADCSAAGLDLLLWGLDCQSELSELRSKCPGAGEVGTRPSMSLQESRALLTSAHFFHYLFGEPVPTVLQDIGMSLPLQKSHTLFSSAESKPCFFCFNLGFLRISCQTSGALRIVAAFIFFYTSAF